MNPPDMPETPGLEDKPNKLMLRSEVLAVIRHVVSMEDPPKQERMKQLRRLQDLNQPAEMQDILVKELGRATQVQTMQVITEFLMELGDLDTLKDKLWGIIRESKTMDEVKDAANLILRHLGDQTDPNLYLEYLRDPEALIERETERMLAVSTENPEALIDFIDFIVSLNLPDQIHILTALQRDYSAEYLVNLYVPLLESDPSPELWEHLVVLLGDTRSADAAQLLARLSTWAPERLPVPIKQLQTSLKKLQLAGVYKPNQTEPNPADETLHPMVKDTKPYDCFATLSDGIGNQGLIMSRLRPNGDVSMMCTAINDEHGIIDCFGFFELSPADFHKICEKFHEGATKIMVPAAYCAQKLMAAQQKNYDNAYRLPYEFGCWKPISQGAAPEITFNTRPHPDWIRAEWFMETDNLYQHPDFNSWFLEQGDETHVTQQLQKVVSRTEAALAENGTLNEMTYIADLDQFAQQIVRALLKTSWRELMQKRLTDASYLLDCQGMQTFRNLAATEAFKLETMEEAELLQPGFLKAYGRRCVVEELLRLRTGNTHYDTLSPLVDTVVTAWEPSL